MKNNNSIVFNYEDIRNICYSCKNFKPIDWYTEPHIDIKTYSCESGGCKELAECYKKEEFLSSFQHKIIKVFL